MAVVANHLTGRPVGGFVGVDVFYVISGYLITGLLLREYRRTSRLSFSDFYLRRVKRILPAAFVVICATVVASSALTPGTRFESTVGDAIWSLGFVANWHFAIDGTNYFAHGLQPSPLQHFWSLAVEEQFYVVWPCLLAGCYAVWRKLLPNERWRRAGVLPACVISAVSLVSFSLALRSTAANPTKAYFSTIDRGWELGLGALIAFIPTQFVHRHVMWSTVVAWLGLTGICSSMFILTPTAGFPAPAALWPVLSTGLLLYFGLGVPYQRLQPLTGWFAQSIGEISYSLYVWHLPIIVLLAAEMASGSFLYYVSAVVLTLFLSMASYFVIERPIRNSNLGPARQSRRGSLAPATPVWGLAIVLVAGVSLALTLTSATSEVPGEHLTIPVLGTERGATCLGAEASAPSAVCDIRPSVAVYPNPDYLSSDTEGYFNCFTEPNSPLRSCSYGSSRSSARTIALVGDSHAADLIPGLQRELVSHNWKLTTFVGEGCVWGSVAATCKRAMTTTVHRLRDGPRFDVVLTSAYRGSTGKTPQVAQLMARAWQSVAQRGSAIVAVSDVPAASPATVACESRDDGRAGLATCSTPEAQALSTRDPIGAAARLVQGSDFVDLVPLLCERGRCPALINNVIVYRDTLSHLTGAFSESLGPYLASRIARALGGRAPR